MIASDRKYGRRVEWLLIANNKLYFFLFNLLFYCFLIERLVSNKTYYKMIVKQRFKPLYKVFKVIWTNLCEWFNKAGWNK